MPYETPTASPARRRMPDLAALDDPTRTTVVAAVERLRAVRDVFAERTVRLIRRHGPGSTDPPRPSPTEAANRRRDRSQP